MKEEYQKEIADHFENFPEARSFCYHYELLCHAVDDLVDVGVTKEAVLDSFSLAIDVYSCKFYRDNVSWIYPLCKNLHRVWSASIAWEHSDVAWKAQYADVLRCCGGEMTMGILEHHCRLPQSDLRRIDAMMREAAWETHHDKEGRPI